VCVNVMGNLSKAKVSPGSRVSAGYRSRGWMSQ
jgi:septal ring factor EnvC (AmiA/AmiB activator)